MIRGPWSNRREMPAGNRSILFVFFAFMATGRPFEPETRLHATIRGRVTAGVEMHPIRPQAHFLTFVVSVDKANESLHIS